MPELVHVLATVIVLGVGAVWLSWWLRVPSILLLLLLGFAAGETGLLDPDEQFGDLLVPIASLSVALILYEGGLSLRFRELKGSLPVVSRLITVGALITWLASAAAAHWILGLSPALAVLLGAILIVTGPTVIQPMLQHMRPKGAVGPVLKWEGIVIDPLGAMLAVLVFEVIVLGNLEEGARHAAMGVVRTVVFGGGLGVAAGLLLAVMLRASWIPDFLDNPVSVMLVVAVYSMSEHLQSESGLLTTTVMGMTLANQRFADVRHIVEFKENLRTLLISGLFILLASRVRMERMEDLGWAALAFLGVLVLAARPLSVAAATIGSGMTRAERLLMAWMAPRGIVAAAVSSVFALRLHEQGMAEAEKLVPLTFLVIVGTVVVYGLTTPWLARPLGVAEPDPQGVLMVGAAAWARGVAEVLRERGFRVLLVDTNHMNIRAARMAGLETHEASVLAEYLLDEIDLGGVGRMIAATPNDWVNTLAVQRFSRIFGSQQVYQLRPTGPEERDEAHRHLHGRWLFGEKTTFGALAARMRRGAVIKATVMTDAFSYEDYLQHYAEKTVPLFVITEAGKLVPVTEDRSPAPKAGDTVVAVVEESP